MKPVDYLFCQMELEGIQRVAGDLIARGSPDVVDFPLVLLARTSDSQIFTFCDNSLPVGLRQRLVQPNLQCFKPESAVAVFEASGIKARTGHFRTYIFPDRLAFTDSGQVQCFSQDDPATVKFGFSGLGDPVFAVEQAGIILSACVSSRQNSVCAEAWVFTHPDHRRKGLAQQVVTAWAGHLKRDGLIPFYSHDVKNTASASLARNLGLVHVFEEITIEEFC